MTSVVSYSGNNASFYSTNSVSPHYEKCSGYTWLSETSRNYGYSSCCDWTNEIKVVNCGQNYVYKLMSSSAAHPCHLGYCGSDN